MKPIAQIVGILLFVFGVVFALCYYSPAALRTEYTTNISVDKPDKIENTISNAVSDLRKRNFVPVRLWVNWHQTSKTYVIYAKGIDRTKLVKYEP